VGGGERLSQVIVVAKAKEPLLKRIALVVLQEIFDRRSSLLILC